ncbi:MAG TPA: hypothetical protein VFH51_18255, partial [Myxococcota bacterium]|nr:hypothetical protein [Myxococcota bacterium]
ARLMPVSDVASREPSLLIGEAGARWVIDREIITQEACQACACTACNVVDACYQSCAKLTSEAMVQAYFRANVKGLGNAGFGWQAGLKNALWAVGIDPEDPNDGTAIHPAYDLAASDAPNAYTNLDEAGAKSVSGWMRDDALLAIMSVTDQQDCSMPEYLLNLRDLYETKATPNRPIGSICNQQQAEPGFHDPNRLARLLIASRDNTASRVAVGFIGGVKQTGTGNLSTAEGEGTDCAFVPATASVSHDCSCLASSADTNWCKLTKNTSGPSSSIPACDGMNGSRYVAFADRFDRRSFETICRQDAQSYGPAMTSFARIATLACFDLEVAPAAKDPNNLTVKRAAKGSPIEPTLLPPQPPASAAEGWYYDSVNNKVCLTGLDRLIGDEYEIFVLETNKLDFTK